MGKRKAGTSIEEMDDWARRMIDDVEDFEFAETEAQWREYLLEKDFLTGGVGLSGNPASLARQLEALERGRSAVQELQEEVGATYDVDIRGQGHIRGATGRFESRANVAIRMKTIRSALALPKRGWDE